MLRLICVFLAVSSAVAAQPAPPDARATVRAVRIDTGEAPTIDGDLSDPAWAKATMLDQFRQVEPVPGAMPTERTVLRIMYDENNLYFAVYAYDSEPDRIVVRTMARDGEIWTGDNISIALDPGLTRRNAYSFQIGVSGGRADALILNNNQELDAWDPIWSVRTRRVADGWIAEFAIPFQSLSYQPGMDWGFEFQREISRKDEEIRWSNANPTLDFNDISQAGTLTGIENVTQGLGLDVQVYGVMRAKRDWHIPGEDLGISFTGGGNAFYRVTPSLTGTLTVNPDFSDAPLDARQVNTTRFSLFFPETRDFFLQDAGSFEFAGRNFSRGFESRDVNNGRPFFSRNIGLVDGEPVSIIAGGKLSGEHEGWGVGALSVLTDKTPFSDEQVLSVARITRAFGESRLGGIVTHGDPTGLTDNTVAGADFQYRDSNFLMEDTTLLADFFYQRSFSNIEGEDDSFGAALAYPNEPWFGEIAFKQIGAHFEPALGFVSRRGIRHYDGEIGYLARLRDNFMRTVEISTSHQFFTTLDDHLETRESDLAVEVELATGDEVEFGVANIYEDVPEEFDIADTIIMPPGRYRWTALFAGIGTSEARPLAANFEIRCCGFYSGSAFESELQLNFRPNEYYEIGGSYEFSRLDLPTGDVDIHVLEAAGTVNFSPDMELRLQLQFDNISEDFGFLARYRWEFIPGGELFVAFGQAARIPDSHFLARRSELSVRLGHTFRF